MFFFFFDHVGCDVGGLGKFNGGFEIGKAQLMNWAVNKELHLMNNCVDKRKSRLIIF